MTLSDRMRRRLSRHHLPLALACSAALLALVVGVFDGRSVFRWSMATAYVALVLLGITLSIGSWQLLRSGRSPLSSDLRRDVGIWTGLVSLAHVAVGLQVHMRSMVLYFFVPDSSGWWLPRVDAFGLGNWAGLLATLVLLLLLALSNDASLRRLGRTRWKALQRYSYAGAVLVVLHGVVYQVLERRALPWVLTFALVVMAVAVVQWAGYRRHRAAA
jgi:methionine sulfoxide reductase heme-binding subunit